MPFPCCDTLQVNDYNLLERNKDLLENYKGE